MLLGPVRQIVPPFNNRPQVQVSTQCAAFCATLRDILKRMAFLTQKLGVFVSHWLHCCCGWQIGGTHQAPAGRILYGVAEAPSRRSIVRKTPTILSSASTASSCLPKEYVKGQASPGTRLRQEAG